MDDDQLTFAEPIWFAALAILVGVILFRVITTRRSTQLLNQLVASRLKEQLLGSVHRGRRATKFWFYIAGLALVIVALARPQMGFQETTATRRGLDVMFAIDTSRSMLAEDIQPNRLDRAKFAILDLLEFLKGDRIGLVGFAGDAYIQCPLTTDYTAFRRILDEVDTNLLPTPGTNIANAVNESLEGFTKSESDNRALILITDGEELDEEAVPIAKKAYEDQGVRVFTLGFGTPSGSQIRYTDDKGQQVVVVDQSRKPVVTKLEEGVLKEVASAAGGFYQRFEGTDSLQRLVSEGLGSMTREDIDSRERRRAIERYQWPLGAGLALLFIGLAIHESPRRRARVQVGVTSSSP